MKTRHFEARGMFRALPEALWPLLADTPNLNRAIGLPPVEYEVTPADGGGSHIEARVRLFGFTLARWREHPFHWQAPSDYEVVREFHSGLLRRLRFAVHLDRLAHGTEVVVTADIEARHTVGDLVVKHLVGPKTVRDVMKQCAHFERYLLGEARDPFPQLAGAKPLPIQAEQAAEALERDGISQVPLDLLRQHLTEARDDEVVKMRPFELADGWGIDRREALALCLHATIAGLLVMTWDVLCPNCRVGKAEYFSLSELDPETHCDACNITFDSSFDRLVEVRFSVAAGVRRVANREFCIGGPMNTPHIVAQAEIEPDGAAELTCNLDAAPYRLRASGSRGALLLQASGRVTSQSASIGVTVGADGIEPSTADLLAEKTELRVTNETDREQVVVLENNLWPDTVATAAMVSTFQEFRDLFSSEALAPGLSLGIESLAFMFTDLANSTMLYQAVGQARAFRLVQDHFRVLGLAITRHRGAVVKTIGDAVMATFTSGADALAAALRIQADMRGLELATDVETAGLVRIGLHQGPCLAVTLNDRLDYFGTTVNTAARIEHEALGGQIVASLAVCESEAAAALLRACGAKTEAEILPLRGLTDPLPVYRITPAGA